jgi:SP family galactose:H+ symporter-like MFS transporter
MVKNNAASSVVIRVSIIAALAGLLFGLDIAYVNGALDFISQEFHLTVNQAGDVAAYLLAGAAVGALGSGWLSRHLGRKRVLVIAALIFTGATLLAVAAHDFYFFLAARFIIGLAVGIASFVAPLYLSEIAPFKIRGALIALYQLMITIGIFLMFISNTALQATGSWRLMLLVLVIPSIIMLLGTLTLPESPRYRALIGDMAGVKQILTKIRGSAEEVNFELAEIEEALKVKHSGFKLLKESYFVKVLLLVNIPWSGLVS